MKKEENASYPAIETQNEMEVDDGARLVTELRGFDERRDKKEDLGDPCGHPARRSRRRTTSQNTPERQDWARDWLEEKTIVESAHLENHRKHRAMEQT